MNEVQRLEVKFREALTSGDAVTLHEIHARAVALVTKRKRPPVIAANKKPMSDLSEVTCVTWHLMTRAYLTSYGGERISARRQFRKSLDIPLEEAVPTCER